MKLAQWLAENGVKRKDFAARIDVSPSYITGLCSGAFWPGREVVERIQAETDGQVTANDFLENGGLPPDAAAPTEAVP